MVGDKANVKRGKCAVINIDDEAGKTMLEHADCRHLTYAINNDASLKAENIQVLASGAKFDIKTEHGVLPLDLKITGIFNVYNVMAAAVFELVRGGQDFAVIVDYAHTPDGLENILKTAHQIAKKRIITVFGCGGDRDNTKRPIMGRIAG
ncbi:unnamed protein product [Cylicocyclus nassatus]|uniref:Mur ligase C-terminal domain-containing protein n=1 Tax=Cylicocyclus nassatus TaxID=53992 RepID=A0AA36M7H9_CYLNA|nr:unnamed protein product [Cylicocyclus nassatus]